MIWDGPVPGWLLLLASMFPAIMLVCWVLEVRWLKQDLKASEEARQTILDAWEWAHRPGTYLDWHEELEDWWTGEPSAMDRFEEWRDEQ